MSDISKLAREVLEKQKGIYFPDGSVDMAYLEVFNQVAANAAPALARAVLQASDLSDAMPLREMAEEVAHLTALWRAWENVGEEQQAESKRLREALEKARTQLRATQENWHEDCLFRCDDILTAALGEEIKP